MDPSREVVNIVIGLTILVGAIQCFFGYRFFKFILGLIGFLAGGFWAGALGYDLSQQEAIALLAGLAGGFIGAALMVALYFIGIFLVGAFLGGVLGAVLFALAESNPEPAVLLILAALTGIIAMIFQKIMIIMSTGFGGAWSVVTGITYFTTGAIDPTSIERLFKAGGSHLYTVVLCWLVLGITGALVQYKAAQANQEEARPTAPPGG
jgi:hypothetical protein